MVSPNVPDVAAWSENRQSSADGSGSVVEHNWRSERAVAPDVPHLDDELTACRIPPVPCVDAVRSDRRLDEIRDVAVLALVARRGREPDGELVERVVRIGSDARMDVEPEGRRRRTEVELRLPADLDLPDARGVFVAGLRGEVPRDLGRRVLVYLRVEVPWSRTREPAVTTGERTGRDRANPGENPTMNAPAIGRLGGVGGGLNHQCSDTGVGFIIPFTSIRSEDRRSGTGEPRTRTRRLQSPRGRALPAHHHRLASDYPGPRCRA